MIRVLLFFLLVGHLIYAQNVSTYFADASIDVDDAMVFDADGNLYGSNFEGDSVYKITPNGTVTVFVTGLQNPNGLAIDSEGNIFVVEYSGQKIHKYNSSGGLIESFDVGPFPSGLQKSPNSDDMYFTGASNNSINVIGTDGSITEIYQGAPLNAPVGLAFDANEVLYVGNFVGREIYSINGGNATYVATVPADGAGGGAFLGFVTFANETLYGTNLGSHRIYTIDVTGIDQVAVYAGSDQGAEDGSIAAATFDSPNGIIYNASQDALYISEISGIGNIRRIDNVSLSNNDNEFVNSLSVGPNPVSDLLELRTQNGFVINAVEVYDVLGRLIDIDHSYKVTSSSSSMIDVSSVPAGMYFVKVIDEGLNPITKRFIKK